MLFSALEHVLYALEADLVPFVLALLEQTRILTVELVCGTIEENELKIFLIQIEGHAAG